VNASVAAADFLKKSLLPSLLFFIVFRLGLLLKMRKNKLTQFCQTDSLKKA